MKTVEIGDHMYKLLEEIAEAWNKKAMKYQKEDPDIKWITNWDPEAVLYAITAIEHNQIKEENENNINKNE